jgi:hypothetical protein
MASRIHRNARRELSGNPERPPAMVEDVADVHAGHRPIVNFGDLDVGKDGASAPRSTREVDCPGVDAPVSVTPTPGAGLNSAASLT